MSPEDPGASHPSSLPASSEARSPSHAQPSPAQELEKFGLLTRLREFVQGDHCQSRDRPFQGWQALHRHPHTEPFMTPGLLFLASSLSLGKWSGFFQEGRAGSLTSVCHAYIGA